MLRLGIAFFLLWGSFGLNGQANAGAGHAINFDGVNDCVLLGNVYDNLELPLTISAWISLDAGGLGTIFSSQDDPHVYSGFHFYVVHNAIVIEYGDGLGPAVAENRRGKSGSVDNIFGRWVHVAAVMRGSSDMDLFLNGINVGGDYIGSSQSPMKSSVPSDSAKIGFRSSIGVIYHFKGMMDELRLWNIALSEDEIREQMCRKLTGNETGLVGYWDFDDANSLIDKTPLHMNGQFSGVPQHVFSGAPVGDESVLLYASDWHDRVLTLRDSLDSVSVVNVTGNASGLHLYEVLNFPSQSGGLNPSMIRKPYFGVFVAGVATGNFFDVHYSHNDTVVCKLFTRPDANVPSWKSGPALLNHVPERTELIKELWDTPLKIDLGPDEAPCVIEPRVLHSLKDTLGFTFAWQDGSSFSKFQVSDFGTYWVNVNDGCTGSTDTLRITRVAVQDLKIPNVFTPNGDSTNRFFEIDERMLGAWIVIYNRWGEEVYQSSNYQNDWEGSGLPTGVYFYRLQGGDCIDEKKGTLSILR